MFIGCVVPCKPLQSRPTLCNPMDCSPPGSSVHGVLQARTLEWVTMPSSRGHNTSQPRDWTHISCSSHMVGRFFTATREARSQVVCKYYTILYKGLEHWAGVSWNPSPVNTDTEQWLYFQYRPKVGGVEIKQFIFAAACVKVLLEVFWYHEMLESEVPFKIF